MYHFVCCQAACEPRQVQAQATVHDAVGCKLRTCFTLILWLTNLSLASHAAPTCPGIAPGLSAFTCTAVCKEVTCEALARFYSSTSNVSSPDASIWFERSGWISLSTSTCREVLAVQTPGGLPVYCSWYGVTCCTVNLHQMGYCLVIGSVWGLELDVNGLTGNVEHPVFQGSIAQLHACGLMSLVLDGNHLSGRLTDFWGELSNLITLVMSRNLIEGTITDGLRNLTRLAQLSFDKNPMHGSLPEWLGELSLLQVLSFSAMEGYNPDGRRGLIGTIPNSISNLQHLKRLGLRTNALTGSIPESLCHPGILSIDLKGNSLYGDIGQFLRCTDLQYLDISNNRFAGTLPDIPYWGWEQMFVLEANDNRIEGTLPAAFYKLPELFSVALAKNRLNGTISNDLQRMDYLMIVNLQNNQLTGQIDESFWHAMCLRSVDLSHNNLTGTLSPAVGIGYFIENIQLEGNQLNGTLPSELGLPKTLTFVSLDDNPMSCSGNTTDIAGGTECEEVKLLPCFLQLSSVTVPRADASYMECPLVIRKPHEVALQDCQGTASSQLGQEVAMLPDVNPLSQVWELDPDYYQFQGCNCFGGFEEVWNDARTVLSCKPAAYTLPPWVVPVAAALFAACCMLLAAVGLVVWLSVAVRLKRKWQRKKDLLEYTKKGMPNRGHATIVVTNLEGYSGLIHKNAEATARAIKIQNTVLRKVALANAGHVIRPGDVTWSVAFHRPVDAVAFCLQVQQALQKSPWPIDLEFRSPELYVKGSHLNAPVGNDPGDAEVFVAGQADTTSCSPAAADGVSKRSHNGDPTGANNQLSSSEPAITQVRVTTTPGFRENLCQWLPFLATTGNRVADSSSMNMDTSSSPAGSCAVSRRTSLVGPSITSHTPGSQRSSILHNQSPGSGVFCRKGRGDGSSAGDGIIRGLRVQMGVASGHVPSGTDIVHSDLLRLATAISSFANGGQILLDSRTAIAVNKHLTELGSVDHTGYNDTLLTMAYHGMFKKQATAAFRVVGCLGCGAKARQKDTEPLLLSMGQFWVPSISSVAAAATTAVANGQDHASMGRVTTAAISLLQDKHTSLDSTVAQSLSLQPADSKPATTAAAVAVYYGGQEVDALTRHSLQLHSITARVHYERLMAWTSQLSFPSDTQRMTKGYFEAPGTLAANLSPTAAFSDTERPLLPAVTMVFAAVHDGKALVRKNEQIAAYVHSVLTRVMQASLLCFPDGYLCREQEAVLKYMLAFSQPSEAAKWCLLVQELLIHIPWPAEVLAAVSNLQLPGSASSEPASVPSAETRRSSIGLKMGLADGIPDSITPDYGGRADYFGASVNLAARIMDAAADAGQVVMSCEMADAVFTTWRYSVHSAADNPKSLKQLVILQADESQAASTPRLPAALPCSNMQQGTSADSKPLPADSAVQRVVHVSAHHIGTYAFKGCGALDMVCLTIDTMPPPLDAKDRQQPKSAKGTLIWQSSGPVVGLQDCPVTFPSILHDLQNTWQSLGAVVPMYTGLTLGGTNTNTTEDRHAMRRSRDRITSWRSVTLTD